MLGSIKKIILFIPICITAISGEVCPADDKKEWTYHRGRANGPEYWKGHCNIGHLQSPINIVTSKVSQPVEPQILMLRNFDKPVEKVLIKNAGQFFTITPKDGVNRSILLDGNEYPFKGFHFHYGNGQEGGGSEHTIDGRRFPMEGHFLFTFPDGSLIQVSSLFELNDEINPAVSNILSVRNAYMYEGDQFEGVIQRNKRNPRKQGKIYFDDILDISCPLFRYTGSNAAPPCTEGQPWLICKTHKHIKMSQLKKLFKIDTVTKEDDVQHDCLMKNNNRPLQDGNNRPVYG